MRLWWVWRLDALSTGLRCSLKRSLSRRLVSQPVPFREVVVLYHVSDVFRVTVDEMGDRSGFTCSGMCMKFVRLICICK